MIMKTLEKIVKSLKDEFNDLRYTVELPAEEEWEYLKNQGWGRKAVVTGPMPIPVTCLYTPDKEYVCHGNPRARRQYTKALAEARLHIAVNKL